MSTKCFIEIVIGAYYSYFGVKKEFYKHAIEKNIWGLELALKLLVSSDYLVHLVLPCEIKATTKVIAIIGRGNMSS